MTLKMLKNIARVDLDTGEIVEKEPPFVKAYAMHIADVQGLTKMQSEVLWFLLSRMNFDNFVCLSRNLRKSFVERHKTTNTTFSNCISNLAKAEFIEIHDSNQYFINPGYFCRSDWKTTKTLVAKWTFSESGVVFERGASDKTVDIVDDDGTVLIEAEDESVSFGEFWSIYPKKVGKKKCEQIWDKLDVDDDKFTLIRNHLMMAYNSTEKKFIPHPSTYLNGENWNDEIITDTPKTGFDSEIPSWQRQSTETPFSGNTFEGELN